MTAKKTTHKKGIVNIHGKQYATVAHRLQEFRKRYPLAQINTNLEKDEDNIVIFCCAIWVDGVVVATGWAEEVRGSTNINKTSALENCESSSVGRALAFMGFGIDGSIAAAEEVENAIEAQEQEQQQEQEPEPKPTTEQLKELKKRIEASPKKDAMAKTLQWAGVEKLEDITLEQAELLLAVE